MCSIEHELLTGIARDRATIREARRCIAVAINE